MKRTVAALAVLALAALALAGCAKKNGSDRVASAGGPKASAAPSASKLNDYQQALKFAQCMRDHGVNMPDPKPEAGGGGPISIQVQGSDGADKSQVDKAQQACQQYAPNGGQPPKLSAEDLAKLRQYSTCMREHGVTNFPDPGADGTIRFDSDAGIDPQSPSFKTADTACSQYRPKGGKDGGPMTNSNAGSGNAGSGDSGTTGGGK
jgi:hypothetical protein